MKDPLRPTCREIFEGCWKAKGFHGLVIFINFPVAINILRRAPQVAILEDYFKEFYWQRHQTRWVFGERDICSRLFGRNWLRRSLGNNITLFGLYQIDRRWQKQITPGPRPLVAFLPCYLPRSSLKASSFLSPYLYFILCENERTLETSSSMSKIEWHETTRNTDQLFEAMAVSAATMPEIGIGDHTRKNNLALIHWAESASITL